MTSEALQAFDHAIQDAIDLLNHFDTLNTNPPPPEIEVLKRASIVMALAALEAYFEDRLFEAADSIATQPDSKRHLAQFFKDSLSNDLKLFHTPSTDRVRPIFKKYLDLDVTDGWSWNNYDPTLAKTELNKLAKKRGEIAHRSRRPINGEPQPKKHAVTRDELRKYIHFVQQLALATDKYLDQKL
jgi:hypothetical protein